MAEVGKALTINMLQKLPCNLLKIVAMGGRAKQSREIVQINSPVGWTLSGRACPLAASAIVCGYNWRNARDDGV